jgi:hypothetical protein
MSLFSNSRPQLEALVARCNNSLAHGKKGGMASLRAYRAAGTALKEMKDLLPRGEFGRVAQMRCGCSKQWRARLLKLHSEWENVQAALQWTEDQQAGVELKAVSVDGALAILRRWQNFTAGKAESPKRSGSERSNSRFQKLTIENASLKDKLCAAAAYISILEEEIAGLSSAVHKQPDRQPVDKNARDKVQKIAALWLRGSTVGERSSAAGKLRVVARRMGCDLRDLLRECSVEGPADWTFARSL